MGLGKRALAAFLAGTLVLGGLPGSLGTVLVKAADDSFAGEEWYDQIDTVEINREPAHAYFIPYESEELALSNEKSALDEDTRESAYKCSLNGEWKFKFAQNPAAREKTQRGKDAADYKEAWDTADWDTIQVPGSIQAVKDANGNFKYEKPIYVNQRYPWANYEPMVLGEKVTAPTVKNSVGQYKRTFTIPEEWGGREVFVSFEGVESAFYLYVNGVRVGYAEDSYTTDEFNITEYLKEGENTIAAEVYRWSTGSYLENQDFIRYSGIFRDVNLYSKGKVELRDLFIRTDFDENYQNAALTLDASVRNLGDPEASGAAYRVTAELYQPDGATKVWDEPLSIPVTVPQAKTTIEEKADDPGVTVTGSKDVQIPKKWFADTPNLYLLLVKLVDENGVTVETACQRVGFRELNKIDINEAGQEQLQINGEKIMFRGTNRHESDVDDGRAITKEDIRQDLMLMKQFNINAIRTSHYPNHPYTYALADELGIYLCDEANVESHIGATQSHIPSGYPVWNTSVMDRTKNMVERDKNHPSVIIWSLGNEATYQEYNLDENYCMYNSSRWILSRDPSRIRKYERDNRYTKGSRGDSVVDIHSSQYWPVDYVRWHVGNTDNKAPYIQSEYAHAMGNALGNFKEYWDIFRSYPNAQGGFIWDWIDQSMRTKDEKSSETYFGYGGDWGETVTDNDFCANGIVFADRTPSPELYEVKKVHQEISFYDDGKAAEGQVRIVNEFLNTNLNQYNVSWTLKKDNVILAEGSLTEEQKNIAAQQIKTVSLADFPKVTAIKGSDYVLTMSVTLKEDQAWAGDYSGHAGNEIAFEEFELEYKDEANRPAADTSGFSELNFAESENAFTITGKTQKTGGKPFEVVIDKKSGYISSYKADEKTLLTEGPVPNFYRAKVNNDPSFTQEMKTASSHFVVKEEGVFVRRGNASIKIHMPGSISTLSSEEILDYTIYANGQVEVKQSFTPASNDAVGNIARIGMKMTVAQGYENLVYYGNGPQENYADRNTGTKLGVYKSTVADQFESKYVRPQENGNRTGVRWTALTDDAGSGVLVMADEPMESSALHYRAEDLDSYRHPYEVPQQKDTILTVDLMQRGLGNASCGPGPLAEYIIQSGVTYTQTFAIAPITEKTDEAGLMERSKLDLSSAVPMPLSGITVDKKGIDDFDPYQTEYTYALLSGSYQEEMVPKIEAVKASDDVEVTVTQAEDIPGTAEIHASSRFWPEVIYRVNLQETDAIYASDMDWASDKGGYYPNARDKCSCGAAMAVYENGVIREYEKGIGSHAPSEITLDLDGMGVKLFESQIGISACQEPGNAANVNFVVKADGEEIFRQNDVCSGDSYPVKLDITGVKRLSLVTEENGADSNDHAMWADAKIMIREPVPLAGISVLQQEAELHPGEKHAICAVLSPDDTTQKKLFYSSSDQTVASVDKKGIVTALAEGTATITVASAAQQKLSAQVFITVKKKEEPLKPPEPKKGTTINAKGAQYQVTSSKDGNLTVMLRKSANKKLTEFTIPDEVSYQGYVFKVTEIGKDAFKSCTKMKSISIGKNIVSIGDRAFLNCKKLTSVTIGGQVTAIGKKAFYNCKALKKITVNSKKLKKAGKQAFKGISKKAVVKAPKKKKKAYNKLFKKAGLPKTAKIR